MNCREVEELAPLYHSGELTQEQVAAFQAHLSACPHCAREMRGQTELDARLRAVLPAEDTIALDRRILRSIAEPRSQWVLWAAATAAALLLAVAGYGGWRAFRSPGVYNSAADDHRREVIENARRNWIKDRRAVEALAVREQMDPSAVADLSGYTLERGKLCRLDGRVYLHLVYSHGNQQISLFLHKAGEPFPAEVREADRGAEHLASFQTRRFAGLVVTDESAEAARECARLAASIL